MKIALGLGALISLVLCPGIQALAQDKALEERLQRVEEELKQYRETIKHYQEQERREGTSERRESESSGAQYPTPVGSMSDIKVERPGEESPPLLRLHWVGPIGLCQAIRLGTEGHRRRVYGHSVQDPKPTQH